MDQDEQDALIAVTGGVARGDDAVPERRNLVS